MSIHRTIRVLARVRRSPACALRSIAGMAAGGLPARGVRRGTVLVLILGALALIAVLTIVYVAIGQGDRRTGEGVVQRQSVDSAAQHVGDYIAQVIADGALATHVDGAWAPSGL